MVVLIGVCLDVLSVVLLAHYVCFHILVIFR